MTTRAQSTELGLSLLSKDKIFNNIGNIKRYVLFRPP